MWGGILKKVVKCLTVFVFLSLFFTLTVFASIPNGTVVMGSKAYDIGYANAQANQDEISNAVVECNNCIYVKEFNGSWVQNDINNTPVSENAINVATYKDANGNVTNYNNKSTVVQSDNSNSVNATIFQSMFGSNVCISLTDEGRQSYPNAGYFQILDGTSGKAISSIAELGNQTTVFPAQYIGSKVTVILYDLNSSKIVTVNNVVLNQPNYNPSNITISYIDTEYELIKQVQNVNFPAYVTAHMSDGTLKIVDVSWDNKDMNISQPGNYTYYGTVNGFNGKAEFVVTVKGNRSSNPNSDYFPKLSDVPQPIQDYDREDLSYDFVSYNYMKYNISSTTFLSDYENKLVSAGWVFWKKDTMGNKGFSMSWYRKDGRLLQVDDFDESYSIAGEIH